MRRQLARMGLSEIDLRPRVGFWWSPETSNLPHPQDFIDRNWDQTERLLVIEYLESSYQVPCLSCGPSWCRLGCPGVPADIGSQDLTDGVWMYPEGLVHYLRHHHVRPTASFLEHLRRNNYKVPSLQTIEPGFGEAPSLVLDVPLARRYEHELVIRFPARLLGWEPGAEVERSEHLLDEFSDQLDQALSGLPGKPGSGTRGALSEGRVSCIYKPILPFGAAEGSEISQFELAVDAPHKAFERIKPLLTARGLINDVLAALRWPSRNEYQVLWPADHDREFQDLDDIV